MTRDERIHPDLRVQRTRTLIVKALIDLTVEKGFAAVAVQDIVKRAGVNRATFYRHYRDKYDLLDRYAQAVYELANDSTDRISPAGKDAGTQVFIPGLVTVLEHVHENAAFFKVMLGEKGDPAFAAKIRLYIQERIRGSMPASRLPAGSSTDLYLSYISSGGVGVLSWWLDRGMAYSPAQMAAILSELVAADLARLGRAAM